MAFSGNAPPQLAVTRRLVERGHEVRVLAHRAARARIESTGAEFVEFRRSRPDFDITRRETDSLRDWEARTRLGAGMRSLRNALFAFVGNVGRECADLLDSRSADVMVFDWMLAGAAIAAESAGLPAVELVHCPYPLPVEGVPPLFTGLRPLDGALGAARDRLLNRIARRVYDTGLTALNRARHEHGLAPLAHWEDQLLGADAIYVMTAPELDFSSRGELPANVRYVGPAFEPHAREWSSPWPAANTDPLVVVSFSTSYMDQSALVQRVLDALAGLSVRALLTAGPALEQSRLSLPANTRTVDFLPHRTVFPHASLVVSHAGWQTVNAALADGVPLLCIPDGRDQPDNAARVVLAGAGLRVGNRTPPPKLRKAIATALEDSALKRGAQGMAAALARSDGALAIVKQLELLGPS
jgi:MGT family glycosyltransferase